MAYPTTPLPVEVGLLIGGAWVDATTTGNGIRERSQIQIQAGRSNWAGQVDPARASFTLDNRDGRWSPDNQGGANWPNYRRNIPTRIGVGLGATYLYNRGGTSGDIVSTPNNAAVNLSSLDLRVEFQLTQDLPDITTGGAGRRLAAKGDNTSNGWWWAFQNANGRAVMALTWFDSGGVQHDFASDSIAGGWVPWSSFNQRIALRTTLDTATGTITHYYGTTASGSTWTAIAQTVIGATSIRNSTTPLVVGGQQPDIFGNFYLPAKLYAFELRSFGGAAVANPNFEAQTVGGTSWTDAAGRVWTVGAGARLTNLRWRYHGELASLPVRWHLSGNDITAPVEAAGIIRRLRQGAPVLESPLRRAALRSTNLVQYWPCEEAGDNLPGFGAAVGTQPLLVIGGGFPKAAANKDFVASAPLPELGTTVWQVGVDSYAGTDWQIRFLLSIPAALTGADVPVVQWGTTDMSWQLLWQTNGALRIQASRAGVAVYDSGYVGTNVTGTPVRIHIAVTTNGGNVDVELTTQVPGGTAGGFFTATAVAGFPGVVQVIRFNTLQNLGATAIGHVTLNSTRTNPSSDLAAPLAGFLGEPGGRRIQRLCVEEGLTSRLLGDPWDTLPMGVQRPATLMALIQECADTDGGILHEARDSFALAYRTRVSMQAQTPLALNYGGGHVAGVIDLDRDDQGFANDITVTAAGSGRTGRAELADGSALSVSQPPVGAGRYAQSYDANPTDGLITHLAGWRLRLSAVNEPRVSHLALDTNLPVVAASPSLTESVLALALGDAITVTGTPTNALGGATIRQLAQGYTETIGLFSHGMVLNTTPASPWDTPLYDGTGTRYDTAGSTLTAGVSAGATSLSVTVATGPLWTTAGGDLPFDVTVGGVRVTVTAISGAASPQTFTVAAVSRALTAGAAIMLADPTYYEL